MAQEYSVRSGAAMSAATPITRVDSATIRKGIIAPALGTVIEWYNFYIFGLLAAAMSLNFFPQESGINPLILIYATFGAGFAACPFGALMFGRVGDLVGRKCAFVVTLLIFVLVLFVTIRPHRCLSGRVIPGEISLHVG